MREKNVRRLVRLYPRAWRERYGEEFAALLFEQRMSVLDVLDVALGAADAWLRPQVTDGRMLVLERMRGSVLAVLWGWVLFVVAGIGFQKMTEYEDFVRAANQDFWVGVAFHAVVVGAVATLAAILLGGMPIVFAALRNALSEGRKDVPLLFCVPPLSLAAFVGYVLLLTKVVYPTVGPHAVHSSLNVALFLSVVGAFLLAAVVSTAAVSRAVTRAAIGARLFRFTLYPAMFVALAMGVVLAALVVWGIALKAQAPALFSGDGGILATNTAYSWLAIVVEMAISACVVAIAVIRGFAAARAMPHASS